eukprot:8550929-Alexandrium_andersonii.AAC.1
MEPLSDPRVVVPDPGTSLNFRRANGFATGETRVVEKVVRIRGTDEGDKQCPGTKAGDASGPAAREASGPPAPGAHPREGKLASARPGRCCRAADIVYA